MRVLIVDDEMPAVERLKRLLKAHTSVQIVGAAHDGLSALTKIEELQPDVVFLDIEMPALNGLEVAKTLGADGPIIVFVTAYDEHALAAFDAHATDYLVKPIATERLDTTMERVKRRLGPESRPNYAKALDEMLTKPLTKLAVKVGAKFEVLETEMIFALSAQDHYTVIRISEKEYLSDESLDRIITRLDPSQFVRVHRGSIINLKYLKELRREGDRKYSAVLNDKTEIPVSRERLADLKSRLGIST